jgi:hypothetical protein
MTLALSTAIGTWLTTVIYVGLLVYAVKQVGEAKSARRAQSRPFVVVDIEPDWLAHLVIENIGKTIARNVSIKFDPKLTSTLAKPREIEDSPALKSGIPTLPPGRKIRLTFDSLNARLNDDCELPTAYRASIRYQGPASDEHWYEDEYVIDIAVYRGSTLPPKGLPDLVKTLEKIQTELRSWTHATRGLHVFTSNEEDYQAIVRQRFKQRHSAQSNPPARVAAAQSTGDSILGRIREAIGRVRQSGTS